MKFWTTIDILEDTRHHTIAALRLILLTGQRSGEVVGMEWNEVDLNGALWTIPSNKSKNEMENRVPLSSLALNILLDLNNHPVRPGCKIESSFVFPAYLGNGIDPTKHMDESALSHVIRKNEDLFKMPHFTPHDLRRTAASKLAELGYAAFVLAILNHKPTGITGKVYMLYRYDKEKRQALDALAEKIKGLVFGPESDNIIPIVKIYVT